MLFKDFAFIKQHLDEDRYSRFFLRLEPRSKLRNREEGLAMCQLINPEFLPTVDQMRRQFPDTPVVIDDFALIDNRLRSGNEWGIDVVQGSSDGIVRGNSITDFNFGAMVFNDHTGKDEGGLHPQRIDVSDNTMERNNK